MMQDLRFGIRMLRTQPSFTLIAALTLALGIGVTSAVLSLIQGVLLTPPPVGYTPIASRQSFMLTLLLLVNQRW